MFHLSFHFNKLLFKYVYEERRMLKNKQIKEYKDPLETGNKIKIKE